MVLYQKVITILKSYAWIDRDVRCSGMANMVNSLR